jgi:DNA polymerase III subunit delta'
MQWTVVGHQQQKEYFEHAATVAHAYLFSGPRGVGKGLFARELAASLCAEPDRLILEPGVEAARGMKRWAYARPLFGARKVVLIDDADGMGAEAANTLLKVLEEPPAYLHFLLISSRSGQVLPTVASRCQEMTFRLLADADMKKALTGLKLDADDKALLAAVAAGRPGEALTLVREKKLQAVATAIADLERMLTSGVAERIGYAKKLADDDNAPQVVSWWLAWTHAQLPSKPNLAPVAVGLLDLFNAASDSKYNIRLALERFLLELPVTPERGTLGV